MVFLVLMPMSKEIAKFFRGKDFMNAPWLFAEAYKYRRLRECFSLSRYWVDYGESNCPFQTPLA